MSPLSTVRTLVYYASDADAEHQLAAQSPFQTLFSSRNFLIVVVLGVVSLAVAIALIVAIVVVRRQDRRDVITARRVVGDNEKGGGGGGGTMTCSGLVVENKYNCRTETIKMLQVGLM